MNRLTNLFPFTLSLFTLIIYNLVYNINLAPEGLKISVLLFSVNFGWISVIHLYKKNIAVMGLYLFISATFTTSIVFCLLDNDFQFRFIFFLFIIGIFGLMIFIERTSKKNK